MKKLKIDLIENEIVKTSFITNEFDMESKELITVLNNFIVTMNRLIDSDKAGWKMKQQFVQDINGQVKEHIEKENKKRKIKLPSIFKPKTKKL